MRTSVNSGQYHVPIEGFSQSIVVPGSNDLVFVSGLTARDAKGAICGSDPATQMRQILTNLDEILSVSGLGLQDVVSIRTYVVDIGHWGDIEPIWKEAWGAVWPTSTMVEVSRLFHDDLLLELEAIAAAPASRL